MIIHNINPIIFEIWHFRITYYALVYLFGFLAVLFVLLRARKRKEIDIGENKIYNLIVFSVIGMIIGARIFHILFWGFDYYSENLEKIFHIWEGGFSFHGGLIGGLLFSYLYCKNKEIGFLKILDIIILPVVFFLALGRIANFINGEILGIATNVSWCVVFQTAGGCRHPVQLYAALGRFALFFFLLFLKSDSIKKKHKDGFLFWNFVFFIGIGRFFLDFLRDEARYFGLEAGQWFSIFMIIIGFYFLIRFYKKDILKLIK